jgi:LDH2 family malate/lactate/ureidoglycolate dehydrogenase
MSAYPGSDRERRVPAEKLLKLASDVFARCGMPAGDAGLLAETLVAADLRGVHSHGVLRVPEYVKKFKGDVNPAGRPRVVKDDAGAIVIDGDNSMGQIGGVLAMRRAIERARTSNVAVAVVRGSNHCGAMAYFAMMALEHDMVGLATTNALPLMAPWGGLDRVVGINPLAAAIPAGEEPPIVLDAAFSYSSHGKMRVFHQKGAPIPPTWAFDEDGRPTTDTEKALVGMLQPIGEYKGVGLAMVMGILSALLSGAAYGTELGNMTDGPKAGLDGQFYMALRIAPFEDPARFKQRMDGIIREVRESRRAPGVARLYSPGELEAETERDYRAAGIPLNDQTLRDLSAEAAGLREAADAALGS